MGSEKNGQIWQFVTPFSDLGFSECVQQTWYIHSSIREKGQEMNFEIKKRLIENYTQNILTYIHTYHTFWPRAKVWVEQGIAFWCGNFQIEISKFIPSTTIMFAPDHGFLKTFFFQTHLVNITIIAWLLIVIFQTLMIFVLYDILILHTSYPKQITKIWLSHLV